MFRRIVLGIGLGGALLLGVGQARGQSEFYVGTDRFGYSGTITYYGNNGNSSLVAADGGASNGTTFSVKNALGTPAEDLSITVNTDPLHGSNSAGILTAAFYAFNNSNNPNNPNNQNAGTVQVLDSSAASVTSATGTFTTATSFALNVTGANAGNTTSARLGPNIPNADLASATSGTFISYALHANFFNLSPAQPSPVYGSISNSGFDPTTNPTAENNYNVSGTFSGVFLNSGSIGSLNGYYAFNFTLNNTSYAYSNEASLASCCSFPPSTFIATSVISTAVVPEPASLVLGSIGLSSVVLVAVWRGRRRAAA